MEEVTGNVWVMSLVEVVDRLGPHVVSACRHFDDAARGGNITQQNAMQACSQICGHDVPFDFVLRTSDNTLSTLSHSQFLRLVLGSLLHADKMESGISGSIVPCCAEGSESTAPREGCLTQHHHQRDHQRDHQQDHQQDHQRQQQNAATDLMKFDTIRRARVLKFTVLPVIPTGVRSSSAAAIDVASGKRMNDGESLRLVEKDGFPTTFSNTEASLTFVVLHFWQCLAATGRSLEKREGRRKLIGCFARFDRNALYFRDVAVKANRKDKIEEEMEMEIDRKDFAAVMRELDLFSKVSPWVGWTPTATYWEQQLFSITSKSVRAFPTLGWDEFCSALSVLAASAKLQVAHFHASIAAEIWFNCKTRGLQTAARKIQSQTESLTSKRQAENNESKQADAAPSWGKK